MRRSGEWGWRVGPANGSGEWNSPSEAEKAPQGLGRRLVPEGTCQFEPGNYIPRSGPVAVPGLASEWNSPSEAEKAPQGLGWISA